MWQPGWEGSLGENGYMNICMAESLHLKSLQHCYSAIPQYKIKSLKLGGKKKESPWIQNHLPLVMWPWEVLPICPRYGVLIYKRGITRWPGSQGCCKIQWDSAYISTVLSHSSSYYFYCINFFSLLEVIEGHSDVPKQFWETKNSPSTRTLKLNFVFNSPS